MVICQVRDPNLLVASIDHLQAFDASLFSAAWDATNHPGCERPTKNKPWVG